MTSLEYPTEPRTRGQRSLSTVALILAAGWIIATAAIGKLLELILKGVNPDGVDVTQGLAYLRPLLITSWSIGLALFVITIVVIVMAHRREGVAAARPAWIVLIVQIGLVIVVVILDASVRSVTG